MKRSLFLFAFALYITACSLLPQAENTAHHPLYISELWVSDSPEIGKDVVIHMTVTAPIDHPDLYMRIDLPEGVMLKSGDLEWTGSLAADGKVSHEVTVCTLAKGVWRIPVRTVSTFAPDDHMADTDTLYFNISDEQALWAREHFVATDFPDLGAGMNPTLTPIPALDTSVCN